MIKVQNHNKQRIQENIIYIYIYINPHRISVFNSPGLKRKFRVREILRKSASVGRFKNHIITQ